jgi:hypothetical protein
LHWNNQDRMCDYPENANCPIEEVNRNRVEMGWNTI